MWKKQKVFRCTGFWIVKKILIVSDAATNHATILQNSIDEFVQRTELDWGPECNVAVYGVDVSTAFTRKIEIDLGVDREYHTYRRGWLCDVSNKPPDMSEVYHLFPPFELAQLFSAARKLLNAGFVHVVLHVL
jgi:hypothetical protein